MKDDPPRNDNTHLEPLHHVTPPGDPWDLIPPGSTHFFMPPTVTSQRQDRTTIQPSNPPTNLLHATFTCAQCQQTFLKARSDHDAHEERTTLFPESTPADCAIICDPCFNILFPPNAK